MNELKGLPIETYRKLRKCISKNYLRMTLDELSELIVEQYEIKLSTDDISRIACMIRARRVIRSNKGIKRYRIYV